MKINKKDIIDSLVALGIISKVGSSLYSTDLFSKLPELIEIYRKSNVELSKQTVEEAIVLDFKAKKLVVNDLYSQEFEDWITSWNQKFPSPKRAEELTGVEKNYRSGLSGKHGVKAKMMDFIIGVDFRYNLNVIDTATDRYIYREYERNALMYLQQSGNFIHKQDVGSKLESECEALLEELNDLGILQENLHLHLNAEDNKNDSMNRSINTDDGWTFLNA